MLMLTSRKRYTQLSQPFHVSRTGVRSRGNSKRATQYRTSLAEVGRERFQRQDRKLVRDVSKDPRRH